MTDRQLKLHVENALGWEPSIDETRVGVSVNDGVVTRQGEIDSQMNPGYWKQRRTA